MTYETFIAESEFWLRLALLILGPIRAALILILHDPNCNGLSRLPHELYNQLSTGVINVELKDLKKRGVLKKHQWEVLFPPGKETNSDQFDITLTVLLIEVCTTTNASLFSFCKKARELRNYLQHFAQMNHLEQSMFEQKWIEGENILQGLNYTQSVSDLKTNPLDAKKYNVLQSLAWRLQVEQKKMTKEIKHNAASAIDLNNKLESLDNKLEILAINIVELDNSSQENDISKCQLDIEDILRIQENVRRDYEQRISNIEKHQRNMNVRVSSIEENITDKKTFGDLATSKALEIVENEINEDWKKLAEKMQVSISLFTKVKMVLYSDKERMRYCFSTVNHEIQWVKLEQYLQEIKRVDILEKILKETSVTRGKETAANKLKEYYKKRHECWNVSKPLKGKAGREYMEKNIKDAYVNLLIMNQDIKQSSIDLHEVIQDNDQLVLIQGISGIGKTSFINSLLFDWSIGNILQDYDFIFHFTCRELNIVRNTDTWKELLLNRFPLVFLHCTIDDFIEHSTRILFVIDGIDELKVLNDLVKVSQGNSSDNSITTAVYDLINPLSTSLLLKKVLICGRSQACETIHQCFQPTIKCKLLEITGFNEENTNTYIDNYFQEDRERAASIKLALLDQDHLKSLARIPIYLSIICNIYETDVLLQELNTITKLYIAALLVYLRNHARTNKDRNRSLKKLCTEDEQIEVIKDLSKFAYEALTEEKVLFSEQDFSTSKTNLLVCSGIVEKCEGDENGDFYQFKHLVLQEFLSALHIFTECIDVKTILNNPQLRLSLSMVLGLVGLLCSSNSGYMYDFAKRVSSDCEEAKSKYDEFVKVLVNPSFGTLNTISSFLYELQLDLSDDQKYLFQSQKISLPIYYHHNVEKMIYLIQSINVGDIDKIKINMKDQKLYANELMRLAEIFCGAKEISINRNRIEESGLTHLSEAIVKNACSSTDADPIKLTITHCGLTDGLLLELEKCIQYVNVLNLSGNGDLSSTSMSLITSIITSADQLDKNLLSKLDLSYCNLEDISIEELSGCIPMLTTLYLIGNKRITSKSAANIAFSLTENRKKSFLKHLDLSSCNLDDDFIVSFSKCLPYVQKIQLHENTSITSIGMEEISNCITNARSENGCCLNDLQLNSCNLDVESFLKFVPVIPYISKLNLSGNKQINSKVAEHISTVVTEASEANELLLKELDLGSCDLCDEVIESFIECIACIETLVLTHNEMLTSKSTRNIANYITNAGTYNRNYLKVLQLRYCDLDDDSVIALAACAPYVKELNLSGNKNMTITALVIIAHSVLEAKERNENKMEALILLGCSLSKADKKKLKKLINFVNIKL